MGAIEQGRIFQAKGHSYGLVDLLGGDTERAAPFQGGQFATVYLSPKDYHRVHMPVAGTLREMVHVPGRLFSVNPLTARNVPRLFARNERVVCLFDTEHGPMALILVLSPPTSAASNPCATPTWRARWTPWRPIRACAGW
ncbi:hypothetical protein G6F50_016198 [Rhizopus delemar]|uniref:phosphatidylserine decarboxylase n=1 Tax=Rhizopus delemar TaxID=936053 RepID=A0A9P6XV08_9FUNG|nr:hypothetical protein G6F50_016198 [Rhizopus delemar]